MQYLIDQIAQICHEANRGYCQAMGDNSQLPWDDAPQWQKDSAILGVKFHMQESRKPSESHESWMAQKVADGWVYGPAKDAENKTHPCLVPYDQLPKEQQAKDYIFKAICDTFVELS